MTKIKQENVRPVQCRHLARNDGGRRNASSASDSSAGHGPGHGHGLHRTALHCKAIEIELNWAMAAPYSCSRALLQNNRVMT